MNTAQMKDEIRDMNMTYLMIAQQMIRQDRTSAIYRLGLGQDMVDLIGGLLPAQILQIASSDVLLCSMRFNETTVLNMVSDYSNKRLLAKMHDAIMMTSQPVRVLTEEAV